MGKILFLGTVNCLKIFVKIEKIIIDTPKIKKYLLLQFDIYILIRNNKIKT